MSQASGAPYRRALLGLLVCLPVWGGLASHVLADDPTPTVAVVNTPEATPEVPTPDVPPTVPAVTREHTRPLVTVVATLPLATESAPTAVAPDTLPGAMPTVTITPVTPPGVIGGSSSVVDVPLPSPQQLEQSARLRFGTDIPAAVRRWSFLMVPAARKYGVSPELIAAVMTMESGGDPLALSGADARGLMQVLHGPWDPKRNVFTGTRMLREYYDQFNDWNLALAAYNAGPNAVLTYSGVPPFRETHDYVIVVSYLWDLYSNHRLSIGRRSLYRSTLQDLERFAKERKKLKRLAAVAGIRPDSLMNCAGRSCDLPTATPQLTTLDPFWPIGDTPDPLQHVSPAGT